MASERERLHNLFPDLDFDPQALRAKYRAASAASWPRPA